MNIKTPQFENRIEILRGLVAFVVIFHHLYTAHLKFDSIHSIKDYTGDYIPPGHLSVLIFFILSGYVIGLSHKHEWEDRSDIVTYLKKRLFRIYPIFFTALLFTYIFIVPHISWGAFFSNISFLSVPLDNVVYENGPVWSLHFEMLYYLLFIPIAYYKINPSKIFVSVISIALILNISASFVNTPPLLLSYLNGYAFWLGGLLIAKKTQRNNSHYSAMSCIAMVLLLFSLEVLNPFQFMMNKLHLFINTYPGVTWYYKCIPFEDLIYLPYCFVLIFILSNRTFKGIKILIAAVFILPVIHLLPHLKNANWDIVFTKLHIACLIIWVISLSLYLSSLKLPDTVNKQLSKLSVLGSISYGIYIIHFPILLLTGRLNMPFEVKFFIYISITIIAAILLERVFQKYIQKKIRPLL